MPIAVVADEAHVEARLLPLQLAVAIPNRGELTREAVPRSVLATALGAAYLAGLAVQFWNSSEEIAALWQKDRVFEPQQMNRDEKLGKWQDAIGKLLVKRAGAN